MKKYKYSGDLMEAEYRKGKGAHQIPRCSVNTVGVGTMDNGHVIIAILFLLLLLYGKVSSFGCLPET